MKDFKQSYPVWSFAVIAIAISVLAFFVVKPFIPALLWAVSLSLLLCPLYQRSKIKNENAGWIKNFPLKGMRQGLPENLAAFKATMVALVVICVPFVIIGTGVAFQVKQLDQQYGSEGGQERLIADLESHLAPILKQIGIKEFDLSDYLSQNGSELARTVRAPIVTFLGSVGSIIWSIILALLTMFFMLRDGHRLMKPVSDLMPIARERTIAMFSRVHDTVHAVFVGTVLVAIIQGTVIGLAYWIAGVPNAFLFGTVSILLCIIPLLGAPILYIPIGISLLLQDNHVGAAIVLGVGFGVVSQIDNILRPFLIGGRVNLHPMAIFFSILGGVLFFGPIGVMAGPMGLTIAIALTDVAREMLGETSPGETIPSEVEIPIPKAP